MREAVKWGLEATKPVEQIVVNGTNVDFREK